MEHVKCLIIGSGPAGYTAAIYGSRANLQPVEYSGMQPGGQLTQTTEVENFPGYPQGVDGNQMMMDLREQAARFGADIRDGSITKVDFSCRPYHLWVLGALPQCALSVALPLKYVFVKLEVINPVLEIS